MLSTNEKSELIRYLNVIQEGIYQNKLDKGFDLNIYRQFCYAYSEMTEAMEACDRNKDDLAHELADVAIYMFGIAAIKKVNLGEAILEKIEKNVSRVYKDQDGVMVKTSI